jgi:hypothetical protein
MASWQGVLQGLMMYEDAKKAEADRAYEREVFERTLTEQRRNALIPELRDLREARRTRLQQIQTAVGIGLSETTAMALQRSGQLGLFLASYDENDGVDPQYIAALDELVTRELTERGANDDTVAAAILSGTSTSRDVSDPDQAMLSITESIISAQTFEEIEAAQESLFDASATPSAIRTFDIDFGGMTGLSTADTKAVRRELAETLMPFFQDAFEITADGDVIITQQAGPEVASLFNEAERTARDLATGPQREFTVTNAANYVASQIESAARNSNQVDAGNMFENFDLIVNDPAAYVEQFNTTNPNPAGVPDPTTELPDPAAAVSSLGAVSPFDEIIDEEVRNQ